MSRTLKTASLIVAASCFSAAAFAQMGAPVVSPTTTGESMRQMESATTSEAQKSASEKGNSMADDKKAIADKKKADAEKKAMENMPKK